MTIQTQDWPVAGLLIKVAEELNVIPAVTILSHMPLDMSLSSSAWQFQYEGQWGKKRIRVPGHAQGTERQ